MKIVVENNVSLMLHLYSLWYMKGEERYVRFFAYLSLFCFSMIGLVLSGNIFQVYIFWELVGVSSFLLIGFYFQKPSAVAAAKKAFIVTRFADFIFLIGILILGWQLQSFDIQLLITKAQALHQAGVLATTSWSVLAVALCCIFVGGAGKSAMFPLHIWLPDAMEGPTPVSALIHSATMVVAGVFLVAKLYGLYLLTPEVLSVIKNVGIISAFVAALIACTQTEIKRILAYSTMSQIGFMLFALGIGGTAVNENAGYTASLFHLFTHAFFKSLLFLCAGAIIHAVHTNNVMQMGGLAKKMPLTHISFLIATLAISGVPPFSGFFSKELIITTAYHQQPLFFAIALVTSALTAFYMFRLYFLVFWHKENEHEIHSHS
ncbi:MAG: NADH-quinone oxidoreductase subunit L, partial [Chitinophagaceae bacterium]